MKTILIVIGTLALLGELAAFFLPDVPTGGALPVLIACVALGLAKVIEIGEAQLEKLEQIRKQTAGPK